MFRSLRHARNEIPSIFQPIARSPHCSQIKNKTEQREADAAVKIQTQARARAARAERERHRQRHAARVGSIRSSGRAAADVLRALSRPGTAATAGSTPPVAVDTPTTGGAVPDTADGGEEREGDVSAWDGAPEALLPITMGMMSMGSMGSVTPTESGWGTVGAPKSGGLGSGSFSLPAAIGVAAVRTPSSVGSPNSVTAAATAAAAATGGTSPGRGSDAQGKSGGGGGGRGDGGGRSPGKVRNSGYATSPPGSGNSNSSNGSRKASVSHVSQAGRSRSPSSARYEPNDIRVSKYEEGGPWSTNAKCRTTCIEPIAPPSRLIEVQPGPI